MKVKLKIIGLVSFTALRRLTTPGTISAYQYFKAKHGDGGVFEFPFTTLAGLERELKLAGLSVRLSRI